MNPFEWTCPHCNSLQTVVGERYSSDKTQIYNSRSTHGKVIGGFTSIVCANPKCKKLTLSCTLYSIKTNTVNTLGKILKTWKLIPESSAKPQPNYILKAVVEDYEEACKIRDLSPKASATLARRCLQGMIRDFCGISKKTLFGEIKELTRLLDDGNEPRGVTPESIEAIDAVRKVGNIGAHMEEDVNVIIPIDPGEAQILIDLIETLFEDWYIAREQRKNRFTKVKALGDKKDQKKQAGKKSLPSNK
ncbi:MAG: DUF4145 domain-containing protein [Proteobacteria bacterium]|nr:DUF4145 domain-containing protein [Pseudomonadota bacterium]